MLNERKLLYLDGRVETAMLPAARQPLQQLATLVAPYPAMPEAASLWVHIYQARGWHGKVARLQRPQIAQLDITNHHVGDSMRTAYPTAHPQLALS